MIWETERRSTNLIRFLIFQLIQNLGKFSDGARTNEAYTEQQ